MMPRSTACGFELLRTNVGDDLVVQRLDDLHDAIGIVPPCGRQLDDQSPRVVLVAADEDELPRDEPSDHLSRALARDAQSGGRGLGRAGPVLEGEDLQAHS